MNSNGDNKSPWNIPRCMETLPNVSPFDVSTVFRLHMLRCCLPVPPCLVSLLTKNEAPFRTLSGNL